VTLQNSVIGLWPNGEVIMIKRLLQRIRKRQEGITGLETAIILIAFVIVASVFSYVVLSAGLFSSQKVKEAVNAGIETTTAIVQIRGDIVAKMESGVVTEIYLCVGIPNAGSPVDFNPTSANVSPLVISYSDADNLIPTVNWTLTKLSTINTDNILDTNELFQVTVLLPTSGNVSIGPYHSFALEIKPPNGPVLPVERTVPGRVSQYVNLH
jgi:flagellin FlaB